MRSLLFAGAVLALWPTLSTAQPLFGGGKAPATVVLHPGWAEPDGQRIAGLRMELDPGWKTYWRSPGTTGVPPRFDWTGSTNVAALHIDWPTPKAFETFGARTIGYEHRMVLPITIEPLDKTKPIDLTLSLFYGVCSDICVPAEEKLSLTIAPDQAPEGTPFIKRALANLPADGAAAGISATCDLNAEAKGKATFSTRLTYAAPPSAAPIVLAEGPEGIWIGALSAEMSEGDVTATGPATLSEGAWLDRSAIRLTLLDGGKGTALTGCAAKG